MSRSTISTGRKTNMRIAAAPKLSLPMLRQLESYIHTRDETGWYYGDRAQFEKRHEILKEWIAAQIVKADRKQPREENGRQ